MIERKDKIMEKAVKEGINIFKSKGDISGLASLRKANVPNDVINRVIFEPHKIRSTD